MIEAIIFDCFGVLAIDGWQVFKQQYFSHDQELARIVSNWWQQVESGSLKQEECVRRIAALVHVDESEVRAAIGHYGPDDELLAYIRTVLKPDYRVGLLSNASEKALARLFSPKQQALFDAVVLSQNAGVTKPSREAYHLIADSLHTLPERCVFVDDQERHCRGAETAGMQAIRYRDFTSFKTELQRRL